MSWYFVLICSMYLLCVFTVYISTSFFVADISYFSHTRQNIVTFRQVVKANYILNSIHMVDIILSCSIRHPFNPFKSQQDYRDYMQIYYNIASVGLTTLLPQTWKDCSFLDQIRLNCSRTMHAYNYLANSFTIILLRESCQYTFTLKVSHSGTLFGKAEGVE